MSFHGCEGEAPGSAPPPPLLSTAGGARWPPTPSAAPRIIPAPYSTRSGYSRRGSGGSSEDHADGIPRICRGKTPLLPNLSTELSTGCSALSQRSHGRGAAALPGAGRTRRPGGGYHSFSALHLRGLRRPTPPPPPHHLRICLTTNHREDPRPSPGSFFKRTSRRAPQHEQPSPA